MENGVSFISRRPVVLGSHGAVACADPRASQAGIDVLRQGGNAADAAVAMAACLGVTNPMSTGLGGDAFCLFYNAHTKQVSAINGSGRAAAATGLDKVKSDASTCPGSELPTNHGHCVTVPGAAAAWLDTIEKFGNKKLSLAEILAPAIRLAEEGFPVTEVAAVFWERGSHLLKDTLNIYGTDLMIDGRSPRWGEVFRNTRLANTLKDLVTDGKKGFYESRRASAIVDAVKHCGGMLSLEDMREHSSTYEEPISTEYHGVRLWETGPNSQGIVALMALNILKKYDLKAMGHNSGEYIHTLVESLRLSFADALAQVADPAQSPVPVEQMLSEGYASKRMEIIKPDRALDNILPGDLRCGTDTVYLTATDAMGNACSFINSNFMGFGTGIVPQGCGFTLQNRGWSFSLERSHPNVLAPKKRPFHTIIPAMLTRAGSGELLASFGVMGGFMQPQGHVQVLLNMLEFGMNPQEALDQPRFCIGPGHRGPVGALNLEEGISEEAAQELRKKGHEVEPKVTGHKRALFGRGHVITNGAWWQKDGDVNIVDVQRVWWAGSDPRTDGIALAY